MQALPPRLVGAEIGKDVRWQWIDSFPDTKLGRTLYQKNPARDGTRAASLLFSDGSVAKITVPWSKKLPPLSQEWLEKAYLIGRRQLERHHAEDLEDRERTDSDIRVYALGVM
jgi:hypothetical protein